MTKKRAFILFGSTTALLIGYIAWCSRSMYLHVPVPEMTELPPEYREAAKDAIRENGMTRPNRFHWGDLRAFLMHPYESFGDHHHLTINTQISTYGAYYNVSRPRPSGHFWPDEKGVSFIHQGMFASTWEVEVYELFAVGEPLSRYPLEKRPMR